MMKSPLAALVAIVLWATAPLAAGQTGDEILARVDRNLTPESFEAYRKLVNVEPDGARREFTLFTLKKGNDNVLSLFLAPASEQGRATLRLGDNMWLYIPDVGKPIRITSLQSVVGGIFNNADIMRLDYHVEYGVQELQEAEGVFVLSLKAKGASVAYDRLKMIVDKKLMLPREIACHASSGMLIKTLRFKDVKDFGHGLRRPAVVETDSPLHEGYRSVMVFGRIRPRDIPDEAFTLSFLPRVDSLR
jgi:outer membrane lipoprotein-sorting protein